MNKSYALRAFRKAGYPLAKRTGFYSYEAKGLHIRAIPQWGNKDQLDVTVWARGNPWKGFTEFSSPSEALEYIERRLSMGCVVSNDWALPNPDKSPELTLIVGGAA